MTYGDLGGFIKRIPSDGLHLMSGVTGEGPELFFSADIGPNCRFTDFWSGYTVTP